MPRGPGCPVGWPAGGGEDLAPVVAAACRAGLVLIDVQPGVMDGGGRNTAVSGFASGEDFVTLLTLAFSTSLTVLGSRAGHGRVDDMFVPADFPGSGPVRGGAFWSRPRSSGSIRRTPDGSPS